MRILLLSPLFLFAQLAPDSMLHQADWISKKYTLEIAKTPPPLISPQPQSCLNTASVWFTIDLAEIASPAFETLNQEELWDSLRELGVQGVYLKGLKRGGTFRTSIGLDPKWGNDWDSLALLLQKKNMVLIGDTVGNSTGLNTDFALALKNVGDYAGLYHLIEVEKRDWKLLPTVSGSGVYTNVPWLTLQELQKRGYVPEYFAPYVKESRWNATGPVNCADGKVRRWIYLKENDADPVIDWLSSSFAGARIAAADVLDSVYNLGQKVVRIDARIGSNEKETLALWTRKLGSFSVQEGRGSLEELKGAKADLMADTLTRKALLHALIAEDAEALKLMYRLFLEEGVETKRLVHMLQPFDQFTCDWAELLQFPRKKFQYYEEVLTGEALRMRLLKEDVARVGNIPLSTWTGYCMTALGLKDFETRREDIAETHLLLAFFYAMQPGAFSFSASDLLGTVTQQPIDLMGTNENTLYASFPGQMTNGKSFAMQLRKMLGVRRDNGLESGELIAVPQTAQPGLMLLVHRLKNGMTQILAINFGRSPAEQILEMPTIRQTTAIDLMTGLAEKKPLDSSTIRLALPPLSGKVILFQTKYYD
jgi:trehalose synthase